VGPLIQTLSVGQRWPGWEVVKVAQDLYEIYYTITNVAYQTFLQMMTLRTDTLYTMPVQSITPITDCQ